MLLLAVKILSKLVFSKCSFKPHTSKSSRNTHIEQNSSSWQGPTEIKSNCLTTSRLAQSKNILRALQKCLLNMDRHRASTSSLESLFQFPTTLLVKRFFPHIWSKQPQHNLQLFSHILPERKRCRHLPLHFPSLDGGKDQWSALDHLFSKHTNSELCLFLQLRCPSLDAFNYLNLFFEILEPRLHIIFKMRVCQH